MTDPDELRELEEVTQHPGWTRIKAMAQEEFGPAGVRYVQELERMMSAPNGEQPNMQNLQVIIKSRREIEGFFRGVEARVTHLQVARMMPVNQSRRGSL